MKSPSVTAVMTMAFVVLAGPALAQSIDLSPVQTLLQGIVDAITGPLGIVIGTLSTIFIACPLLTLGWLKVSKQDLLPKARDEEALARRP